MSSNTFTVTIGKRIGSGRIEGVAHTQVIAWELEQGFLTLTMDTGDSVGYNLDSVDGFRVQKHASDQNDIIRPS